MKNKSGNTAHGAAAFRLIEQYEPEDKRLFNDPVIYHLTNSILRFILKSEFMRNYYVHLSDKMIPGIVGAQICRTKFIDEKTSQVLKDVEQILILGAGLDTRALRIEGIEQKVTYEIDLPEIQKYKKRKLIKFYRKLPASVNYIPVDFNEMKTETALSKTSFDYNKRTLVIFEAVIQYMNSDAVNEVFNFLSKLSNNSYLLFTYVLRDVIERKNETAKKLMDWSDKHNCPFLFGINQTEIESFLKNYNLDILEDVGAEFYQEKYLKPVNRNILILEGERTNLSRIIK
ncbi:MAG: SAM-dependent methyltransferase [Ignavibacteriaceae bacterium]